MLPKMEVITEVVRDNIDEYKKYSKKHFDKDTKPTNFKPGMKFWLEVKQFQLHTPNKLQQKYVGPYYIADKIGESPYRLRSCETNELYKTPCHVERFGECFEPRNEWNSITGTQGGPPPKRDEDSTANNQEGLNRGHGRPKKGRVPRAASTSSVPSTSNTKDIQQNSPRDTQQNISQNSQENFQKNKGQWLPVESC